MTAILNPSPFTSNEVEKRRTGVSTSLDKTEIEISLNLNASAAA